MEELIEHFRFWNLLWEKYDSKKDIIKPASKEVFIKELSKRYTVTKIKNKNE